jgi:hypothetical protein
VTSKGTWANQQRAPVRPAEQEVTDIAQLNTATGRRRDVGTSTLTECRGLDVLNEYGKPVFRISLLAELLEAQVTESVAVVARA